MHRLISQRGGFILNLMAGHDETAIAGAIGGKVKSQSLRVMPCRARHPAQINDIIDVVEIINIGRTHVEGQHMLRRQQPGQRGGGFVHGLQTMRQNEFVQDSQAPLPAPKPPLTVGQITVRR